MLFAIRTARHCNSLDDIQVNHAGLRAHSTLQSIGVLPAGLFYAKRRSVGEPKVKPLVALVGRGGQIMVSLVLRHGIPRPVPSGVASAVVEPNEDDENNVPGNQTQENLITNPVEWCVRGVVDLRSAMMLGGGCRKHRCCHESAAVWQRGVGTYI
jgi:hypothetical protein